MRRCKIVTWILILSIVNFALGALAVEREGREMPLNVDVLEGGTVTSQKRKNPTDDSSTSNPAAEDRSPTDTPQSWNPSDIDRLQEELDRSAAPTPQSWDPSDLDRLREELDRSPIPQRWDSSHLYGSLGGLWYDGLYIPTPKSNSPVSVPNGPNYAPSNPGSPTGSHEGPTPGGSPLPSPSEGPLPSTPGWSVNTDTSSPQSLTSDSPLPPLIYSEPSDGPFSSTPVWLVNHGSDVLSPQSPTGGYPLPPLSEGHFPSTPDWSVNPDTLSPQSPSSGSPLTSLTHLRPSEGPFPNMPVQSVSHGSDTSSPQSSTGGSPLPLSEDRFQAPSSPVLSVNSDTSSSQTLTGDSNLPLTHSGPSEGLSSSTSAHLVNPNSDTLSPQSSTSGSPLSSPSGGRFQVSTDSSVDILSSPSVTSGYYPLPPPTHSGQSEGPSPSTPVQLVSPDSDTLSPQSSMGGSPLSEGQWSSTVKPVWLATLSPQSPTGGSPLPPLPHPWPSDSEDRLPTQKSPWEPAPHPPPSQTLISPWGSTLRPLASPSPMIPWGSASRPPPSLESSPDEFLDNLLKGKIRRRSSAGSGAMDSAQRDPRSTNVPT